MWDSGVTRLALCSVRERAPEVQERHNPNQVRKLSQVSQEGGIIHTRSSVGGWKIERVLFELQSCLTRARSL